MSNDYYVFTNPGITTGKTADASLWTSEYELIEDGFDKFPDEDEINLGTIQYGTDGGAADAYAITLPHTVTSYTDGMCVVFKAANANTGASTINVDSVGAVDLKRQSGADLVADDIVADKFTVARYNSTSGDFEVLSSISDPAIATLIETVSELGIVQATTEVSGISETATDAEAKTGTAVDKVLTASNVPAILKVNDHVILGAEIFEDGPDSSADDTTIQNDTNGTIRVRKFAGSSTQDIIVVWPVPNDIVAGSGVTFWVETWVTESTTPSSEGWTFQLSGYSIGSGDGLDGTFGSAVNSAITGRSDAQYDRVLTTESGTVTITDLAAGETVVLHLVRDHDDAGDTYVQDIGVSHLHLGIVRQLTVAS